MQRISAALFCSILTSRTRESHRGRLPAGRGLGQSPMLPNTACIAVWRRHAAVFVDDHRATALATFVHYIRRLVVQRLVRPFAILIGKVARHSGM